MVLALKIVIVAGFVCAPFIALGQYLMGVFVGLEDEG